MIRFTWRQFRSQAALAVAALIALAVAAAVTRPHLTQAYDTMVAGCAKRGNCDSAIQAFRDIDSGLFAWFGIFVVVVPGLLGVFWGSTLIARELETGTSRLAWTQSVTRTRWLAVKLAVIGLAAMVVAGLFSLIVTWWASPLDRAGADRFSQFDMRGIVPIGHAAFAFVLGVTLGAVLRRLLPAMATTLVSFVALRLVFNQFLRPHLIAPLQRVVALTRGGMGFGSENGGPMTLMPDPPRMPNAWIYSSRIVDGAGHDLPASVIRSVCPNLGAGLPPPPDGPAGGGPTRSVAPKGAIDELRGCVTKLSAQYHTLITYQPAHRYWPLQWIELGVYLAAAVALAGFAFWWVRRRLA
jgi:hypothetical protein